ncbi:type II secretion system protein [Vibrio astriarenae]
MKSRVFTLIELVVVIVILGILAVVAAPRFLNIQSDARIKTIESVIGAFISAQDMVSASGQMPMP